MKRLPLPSPRPVLYPLRDTATAIATIDHLSGGRRRVTIDHQPLAGVTPPMLLWWFRNIGGTMRYCGSELANYLVWHPLDHIHWELARPAPAGGAGEGAQFRIVEAFARRPEFYVDTTDTVEKLDATEIRLVTRIAGVVVLQLEHTWVSAAGTHYVSVLDIGARPRLLQPLNWYLRERRFPDSMLRAWLQHNIEEVGLLEKFLPQLYIDRAAQVDSEEAFGNPRATSSAQDPGSA